MTELWCYRIDKAFEENMKGGAQTPSFMKARFPEGLPTIRFLDKTLKTTLGISACPAGFSSGVTRLAPMGYSIFTYPTVRTHARQAPAKPNILFVKELKRVLPVDVAERFVVDITPEPTETMAHSFGEACSNLHWHGQDIARAKACLGDDQVLLVSIRGEGYTPSLARQDWCQLAYFAKASGADAIELSLSPRAEASHPTLWHYSDDDFKKVLSAIASVASPLPIVAKLPFLSDSSFLANRLQGLDESGIAAVTLIDSVPMRLDRLRPDTGPIFGWERRLAKVSGQAIYDIMMTVLDAVVTLKRERRYRFQILATGGIQNPLQIRQVLQKGADVALAATAVMLDPCWAMQYLKEFNHVNQESYRTADAH